MITILLKESFSRRQTITVCDDPTPGTWGSHQLLLHEYRGLEDDNHWAQAWFNYRWLKDMELDYGPLWCSYCGKEELKIYRFNEKQYYGNMATADHFIPQSKAPHLAKERSNLRVACWKCNNKKAAHETWKIYFPYD
jgi:hypothetical protein